MTPDHDEAVVAAAQAPLRALCREMLGTLRARGVPPVPVVAFRRPPLSRYARAVRVDVAWPLRTLHTRHPALFPDGSLRPAHVGSAPDGDGVITASRPPEAGAGRGAGRDAGRGSGRGTVRGGGRGTGRGGGRVRWEHALVGTRPGSVYLCDAGDALVPATAVPSRFVGMPMPGGAGGDLGVATPSGHLLYPTVERQPDGEEVSWWPLAAELAAAVARLAEDFAADPWPDPRTR